MHQGEVRRSGLAALLMPLLTPSIPLLPCSPAFSPHHRMPDIDFDKDSVPKEVLDGIVVDEKHFSHALGVVHPSSLRENQVEVPDVKWEDVGGLEDVKREVRKLPVIAS